MRLLIINVILLTTVFLSGCSSIIMRSWDYDRYYVYPGVRGAVREINHQCGAAGISGMGCIGNIFKPLFVIDLPFSFVVDTVLLPVDGIIYGVSSKEETSEEQ